MLAFACLSVQADNLALASGGDGDACHGDADDYGRALRT
jgi:hypothetical protein